MASIRKRENGKWRARYRDEAGKEHARHFARKVDAQAWLDEVTAAVVTGTYVDPGAGRITFEQWFAVYAERQTWTASTAASAAQAASSVTFANVPMGRIAPSHVQQWVKQLQQPAATRKKGLAASTVHTRFAYVHAAFLAAVRDKIISADPCEGAKLPRKPKADVTAARIPTPEGVGKAITSAPAWFSTYVAVCAFAGLRLGEAAGLQVGDVDFLRRTIRVQRQIQGTNVASLSVVPPKYGSERLVHVPEALTDMIAAHMGTAGTHGDEQWLFADVWGQRLNRSSAGHQWRRLRVKVGLGEFTLHDLRHFYASGLIAQGCDVVTVQRALGHSSAAITLGIYSHLWLDAADRTRAAASSLMESALGASADCVRTESGSKASDLRV